MKKRSATKPSPSLPEITFFTDRDLGKSIPHLLRERGLRVEAYFDHFDDVAVVADDTWLQFVFERNWVALSHDNNIRTDSRAVEVVLGCAGRLFILRGKLGHSDLAKTFLEALPSIERLLRRTPGPFIANVRRVAQRGGELKASVELMLKAKR